MDIVGATPDGKVMIATDVKVMTIEEAEKLLGSLSQSIRVAKQRRPIIPATEVPKQ